MGINAFTNRLVQTSFAAQSGLRSLGAALTIAALLALVAGLIVDLVAQNRLIIRKLIRTAPQLDNSNQLKMLASDNTTVMCDHLTHKLPNSQ